MIGNSTIKNRNAAVLSITKVEADEVVPSTRFDDELADTFKRVRLPRGLLERLAGIEERRMWAPGRHFSDGATEAGQAALDQAGIKPEQIGLFINSSVTRDDYEPAVAVGIHHRLGMPSSALNFDITNACLGFLNAVTVASSMIDSGAIEYALIVNGEDPLRWHRAAVERLKKPGVTRDQVVQEFATLTLGSGAAAAVVGPADRHPDGHRIVGSVTRAGTQYHELCVGGEEGMITNATGLLNHGVGLVVDAMREAENDGWDWLHMDSYVTHQVSNSHTNKLIADMGLDPERVPLTFPFWGNVAAAALPMTLALQAETLTPGDRVLCLGVGSGLNTTLMELAW
ncbi:3-oxoacyl-ACP synthase III [Kocuria sp. cx-455]|uniref:3-oxoacyl-ACP synthase III n=1 Tax=Kocuria sp. cx-455 TaxID=2771377 RepID=UPI0016855145|nr:3-oxoacyl-ACP synthase III [Kocuria sp. cx-455]MBD2764805.1 3-oxoacyl-ACP synthase III [Kocuria sp. cx-455]